MYTMTIDTYSYELKSNTMIDHFENASHQRPSTSMIKIVFYVGILYSIGTIGMYFKLITIK